MIPFRHALVTGGGSGVGRAIALALAAKGVEVTVCGRRIEALEETAAQGPRIHAIAADVTSEASIDALYERAQGARGAFDIVVANAGGAESAPAAKTTLDQWQETISLNMTGAFLSVRPAMDTMRKARGGRIVFIASTAGLKGYAYVAPYVAAKHGVVGLTKTVALELAGKGVTCNAVCPGFVLTPLVETQIADRAKETGLDRETVIRDVILAKQPSKEFATVEEIGAATAFLASKGAAQITGTTLSIDGGWTAQ